MPVMQNTRGQFLDWEGPLEKGMAAHSSILAWRITMSEEPGGLQSMDHKDSDMTLCDSMDYGPPGSSVRGISQAILLEWVTISFSV